MKRYTSIAAVARHDAFGCVQTRWLGYSRGDGREGHCTGLTEGEHFARPFTSLFRFAIDDATRIDRSRRAARCVRLGGYPLAGLQPRRRPGTTLSRRRLCGLFFSGVLSLVSPAQNTWGGRAGRGSVIDAVRGTDLLVTEVGGPRQALAGGCASGQTRQ